MQQRVFLDRDLAYLNSMTTDLYSGTTFPMLLQNSHRAPLPPSQLAAFTSVISFIFPGSA